jgi:uncharacterized membrane protein
MDATEGPGQPGYPPPEGSKADRDTAETAGTKPPEGENAVGLLWERLTRLERSVPGQLRNLPRDALPAWRRVTEGEARWQVSLAVATAIALQLPVSGRLALVTPVWLLPALEALLALGLIIANPRRINRQSVILRYTSLTLIALISLANAWSAARLIFEIVKTNSSTSNASNLLVTGGAIWLTNVIAFALWYWEFDRGGPVARALASKPYPDFQFPQMTAPELAPPTWEPMFTDYFYLSFTNATAFSPTDVMPLSRWAKMLMLVQSAVSLLLAALVIARAVNILR